MRIGQVFKAASVSFKEQRGKLITFAFSWGILIAVVYILFDMLIGLGLLATFLVFLPLQVSVGVIAAKAVNRRDLYTKDFYLGFKGYGSSLFLQLKTLIRGILFALLGFFVGTVAGGFVLASVLMYLEPELFTNISDAEALLAKINEISWMPLALNIMVYFSTFIGGIFFVWQGCFNVLAPFICYETRFNVINAFRLSQKYVKANKWYFFRLGFIFLLLLVPLVALGVFLNKVLVLVLEYETLAFAISVLVSAILIGVWLIYTTIAYYHVYQHYFKEAVFKSYENHLVKMAKQNLAGTNEEEDIIEEKPTDKD